MKKIVLCKVEDNRERLFVPFGLLYLSDALEKKGFSTEVLHVHQKDLSKLYSKIKKLNLLFVGFSVLTGQSLIPTIEASKKVKAMNIPVVWGGVHATILPELCAKQDYIDYVVLYEGEETVCELADALNRNKDPKNIKGIATYENGKFFKTPFRGFVNLDDYRPDFSKLDLNKYFFEYDELKKMLLPITSRGCPFRCGFCYNVFFNKRRWRAHSVDAVMEQVNYLKKNYSIDGVYFHDDMFFVNKERGKKIIEMIELPFLAEMRATEITTSFVRWLEKNDCRCVYIGAESGSDMILKLINKDVTTKDIERAVKNLKGTKIVPRLSFIIGFPGETKKDRDKTSYFIKKLKKINDDIRYELKMYNPYPGTPLWEDAVKNGFKSPTTNEGWSRVTRDLVPLPWLSYKEYVLRRGLLFISVYGIWKQLKLFKNSYIRKQRVSSCVQSY